MSTLIVSAAYFGIVLGLAGLGGAWRAAHRVWGLPALFGEALTLVAALLWAALIILYAAKWFFARNEAVAELDHPVQCCFVGLIGVATSLMSLAAQPYSSALAGPLFFAGALFTLVFALWRTGLLWRGERDPGATTAVLYLPLVAGAFVTATAAAALGYPDWGQLAFGAGLFSWLAIESVLLHRLYTAAPLPAVLPTHPRHPTRPTNGWGGCLSERIRRSARYHSSRARRLWIAAGVAPDPLVAVDHGTTFCPVLLGLHLRGDRFGNCAATHDRTGRNWGGGQPRTLLVCSREPDGWIDRHWYIPASRTISIDLTANEFSTFPCSIAIAFGKPG